jgi:prepilin-type processing-associated H-X9-DG protein
MIASRDLACVVTCLLLCTTCLAQTQASKVRPPDTTTAPATSTAPASAPAIADDEPSVESMKAAEVVFNYLSDHPDVTQKLADAKFDPSGDPAEFEKLRAVLPPEVAAKINDAMPAFVSARKKARNAVIGNQLKAIGIQIALYAEEHGDRQPATLTALLPMSAMVRVFAAPEVKPSDDVVNGDAARQDAWVRANTMFVFFTLGQHLYDMPNAAGTIIAAEKPELDAKKPKLQALFADGHVAPVDRAIIEDLVKKQAK